MYQYSSMQHTCCQSLLSPGRVKTPTEKKRKKNQQAVQPEPVCTLILSSLLYLFSFFNTFLFHFVLREVDVVVSVVAVSGNWRWKH